MRCVRDDTSKTRQGRQFVRNRYIELRRHGVSQTVAGELTDIPRTSRWRYDRAAFGDDLPPVKRKAQPSGAPRALERIQRERDDREVILRIREQTAGVREPAKIASFEEPDP